jgi:hypothetical protein
MMLPMRLARRLPRRCRCEEQSQAEAYRAKERVAALWRGTHNCVPLPGRDLLVVLDEAVLDEMADGIKPIWIFDNQVQSNPISISTLPPPSDRDSIADGGHFGPHNIHENRPGSLQSETLIFSTWHNAGVRT